MASRAALAMAAQGEFSSSQGMDPFFDDEVGRRDGINGHHKNARGKVLGQGGGVGRGE